MLSHLDIGRLVGIEHEYRVLLDGLQIDFRRIIHRLRVPGLRIDPADPNAYRCDWGGTITADGREAEIAIPPVARASGFTDVVDAWCGAGHDALASILPARHSLVGYSTHISVAMPTAVAHRLSKLYAVTFAPTLMLLMDRRGSPGLLIRPRPGRLELGGEFVAGEALRAALAFAVGSLLALARGIAPARLGARTESAVRRYGLFVPRDAFGPDLYEEGRAARFANGETAAERLAASWALARPQLDASGADLRVADRVVAGLDGLPSERSTRPRVGRTPHRAVSPFAGIRREIARPAFIARAAVATWDFVVYELRFADRALFACVPRDELDVFRTRLELGALDAAIAARARRRWPRTSLHDARQTNRLAYYDTLGEPYRLLAAEHPSTVSLPPGVPSFLSNRPGKDRPSVPRFAGIPTDVLIGALGGLAAAAIALAIIGRPSVTVATVSSTASPPIAASTPTATTARAGGAAATISLDGPVTLRAQPATFIPYVNEKGEVNQCSYVVRHSWVIEGWRGTEQVTYVVRDGSSVLSSQKSGIGVKPEPTQRPGFLTIYGFYDPEKKTIVIAEIGGGHTDDRSIEITFVGNHPLRGDAISHSGPRC